MPTLGQIIKKHREQAGLTQTGLAAVIKATQPQVADLENDKANPTLARLHQIAGAFGVPLWKLLRELSQ
jgi:transcriptional regulator with XRE-family HTH domain